MNAIFYTMNSTLSLSSLMPSRIVGVAVFLCLSFMQTLIAQASSPSLAKEAPLQIADSIITFDKLTTTIIPFTAPSKPSVTIEPALGAEWTLKFARGSGTITVPKFVAAGTYSITLRGKHGESRRAIWKVLPSRLDARTEFQLSGRVPAVGKPFTFSTKLPAEASLPLREFSIVTSRNKEPLTYHPYTEQFVSEPIAAADRIVGFGVVWTYPATKEQVVLRMCQYEPIQTAPTVSVNPQTHTQAQFLPDGTLEISITGIQVDYHTTPIDAVPSTNGTRIVVYATAEMAELVGTPNLVMSLSQCEVYQKSSRLDAWMLWDSTVQVVKTQFHNAQCSLVVHIKGVDSSVDGVRGRLHIEVPVRLRGRRPYPSRTERVSVEIPLSLKRDGTSSWHNASLQEWRSMNPQPINLPIKATRGKGNALLIPLDYSSRHRISQEYTPDTIPSELYRRDLLEEDIKKLQQEYHQKRKSAIADVYALVNAERFLAAQMDSAIIALVCFKARDRVGPAPLSVRFADSLLLPRYTFKPQTLDSLPTEVIELSTDPNNPGMLPVRGSIIGTSYKTMKEYVSASLYDRTHRTYIYAQPLWNAKGECVGLRDINEVSSAEDAGDITLIALDTHTVRCFRERFTPTPYRTPAIAQAEIDCPATQDIRAYIAQHKHVPWGLIDEAPNECEIVKNFYNLIQETVQIQSVYAVLQRKNSRSEFALQEVVATASSQSISLVEDASLRGGHWMNTILSGCLNLEELKAMPTRWQDWPTGKWVEFTTQATMAEYIDDYVQQRLRTGLGERDAVGRGVRFAPGKDIKDAAYIRSVQR